MSPWTFVGHAHTRHSQDSLTRPRTLVARAVALGVDVLAVTDHDTWRGAVEALGVVERTGARLRIVIGSEASTPQGDVIGLFLQDEPRAATAPGFCDAVHEQAGLVLLPHPFKWHRLDEALLSRVDLVEVYNGRTARAENEQAARLAQERGLPALAGPDAHRAGELHLARVEFDGDLPPDEAGLKEALLHAPRRFRTARGSIWDDWLSAGVAWTRHPEPATAWRLVRGALRRVLVPRAYDLG
jgi:hypothetical protein